MLNFSLETCAIPVHLLCVCVCVRVKYNEYLNLRSKFTFWIFMGSLVAFHRNCLNLRQILEVDLFNDSKCKRTATIQIFSAVQIFEVELLLDEN